MSLESFEIRKPLNECVRGANKIRLPFNQLGVWHRQLQVTRLKSFNISYPFHLTISLTKPHKSCCSLSHYTDTMRLHGFQLLNSTKSSRSSTPISKVGWIDESPGRGTLSLIITCLFTIFLCTWVVIHPRVSKRPLLRRSHKVVLCLKAIIAPEFIAVEGLQEWSQAQRMVKECAASTREGFKLVHAFYIGMLALRYKTPHGDRVIWPNQYAWLLQEGLIDWNDHALWGLSEEIIRDKSNADGTAKILSTRAGLLVCCTKHHATGSHASTLPA